MSYLSVAAEPEYTGDCYNIAVDCQNALLRAKALLKTGGFRIKQSGDGNSLFSTSGDVLDNDTITDIFSGTYFNDGTTGKELVPGSICNLLAWFIVAPSLDAHDQGELCIQVMAGFKNANLYLRIKFSAGGFASATSASETPGPLMVGDEQLMEGDGTDAAPTASSGDAMVGGPFRMQAVVSSNGAQPFFGIVVTRTGGEIHAAGIMFALVWDTAVCSEPGDEYENVCGYLTDWGVGQPLRVVRLMTDANVDDYITAQGNIALCTRFGSGLTVKVLARDWGQTHNSDHGMVGVLGKNSLSELEALRPIGLARLSVSAGPISGFKGVLRTLKWVAEVHSFSEELNITATSSREQVAMQDVGFPWAQPTHAPVP